MDKTAFRATGEYCVHLTEGAQITSRDGEAGVMFAVWAPHARQVNLVGHFNNWQGYHHPMQRDRHGRWSLFVRGVNPGTVYCFEVYTSENHRMMKFDPVAFTNGVAPDFTSRVADLRGYSWQDGSWMAERAGQDKWQRPINIYEVHPGSWRRHGDGRSHSFRDLGYALADYVKKMGYTHIELMPVMEHPFEGSWGYQCTGYFAPNSRLGSPHDLMFLIDRCHQLGIGVILDWVPGHFCRDPHGLAWYDGRPCYEYEAYRRSVKNDWGSNNFALGRKRVQTFLISSALFWLQYYHADGLRVDAVENMMRISGMRGNAGFRFLRKLNQVVAEKVPGAMMIAEDARPARQVTDGGTDGLGFTYRWNMGWCHDVLRFFRGSDSERHLGFEQFLFTLEYAHDENFVLSLSHDEAAYGRGSLLDKMPGDSGTRLKNLKLLLAWQICHPGKKLLFMGAELAQQDSWRFDRQLDWARMRYQKFRQFNEYVRQLNLIYRLEPGLWQLDRGRRGTSLEFVDRDNLVLLIGRHGWIDSDSVWGIFNFSGRSFPIYRVGWGRGRCRLLLCSEWRMFGGPVTDESRTVDCQPLPCHGQPYSLEFTLPAYSVCIFKPVG